MLNNSGPRTDPCGTPRFMVDQLLTSPEILTLGYSDTTNDDTLRSPQWWQSCIMTVVDFRYYTHGLVNIRITIAIHCHLPRCLECKSLSYYSVSNTLVHVTGSAKHSVSHFEQWVNFLWQISHKCVKCVLACLEIYDTGLTRSMETSHIVPQSDRNQHNVASRTRSHFGTMMQYFEKKYFIQSQIKIVFSYKTKFLFNCI